MKDALDLCGIAVDAPSLNSVRLELLGRGGCLAWQEYLALTDTVPM